MIDADVVVARLAAAAGERPANAYLLSGGDDATGIAAMDLAVALSGVTDDRAAAVRDGRHPDVTTIDPAGANAYLAGQLDEEILPTALRAPLEAPRRVLVLRNADVLGDVVSSALLKTLEEPPPATSFILCTDDAASVGDTIVSRCVAVALPPLPPDAAGRRLADEGLGDATSAAALVRATGSVEFARRCLREPSWAQRRHFWLDIPSRIGATPVPTLVAEIMTDAQSASDADDERRAVELETLDATLGGRAAKVRGRAGAIKAVEDRHARERRGESVTYLRLMLATFAAWYRDALAADVGVELLQGEVVDAVRRAASHHGVATFLRAIERIDAVNETFAYNANIELAVEHLLWELQALTVDA